MSQELNGKLDALADKVRRLCENALAERAQYLVSRLGLDLGDDLGILKASRIKLLDFIKDRLSDRFQIIDVGQHSNIQAIVRVEDHLAQISAPMAAEVVLESERKPKMRFNRRFWGAFAVPLTAGVRLLDRHSLVFSDRENLDNTGDAYIITPEFVVGAESERRDLEIAENIDRWLRVNNLAAEQFLLKKERRSENETKNTISDREITALDAFIGALDRRQQASVSLPVDVIVALMRARIRA